MKIIITFFFTFSILFASAQGKGWSSLVDSMGTELTVLLDSTEYYFIVITEEKSKFDDLMKVQIDSWLSSMNSSSKKNFGVLVNKSEFKNNIEIVGTLREVARKKSLKDDWVIPK